MGSVPKECNAIPRGVRALHANITAVIPFPDIDPVAVTIGPLAVRWYGIAYLAAFGVAWGLVRYRARRRALDWSEPQISDLIFYAALGAVFGGRLGHVVFYNLTMYLSDPIAIFKVWEGGMSFHGGLIGVLIAMAVYGKTLGKDFLDVIDFLAPAVPPGLCFGRIANFINGELWGRPADLPWAVIFPDPAAGGIPRHPSQLYEAFLEGVLLFCVLWIFSSKARPRGAVSGVFLLGYGLVRFVVEFAKVPEQPLGYLAFGWLTMGQALTVPMLMIGMWWIRNAYLRPREPLAPLRTGRRP